MRIDPVLGPAPSGLITLGLGVTIVNLADNTEIVGYTTAGVTELETFGGTSIYDWSGDIDTVPSYMVMWSLADGTIVGADKESSSTTVYQPVIATAQPGVDPVLTPYVIKRGDTREPVYWQASYLGVVVDVSTANLLFKMRTRPDEGALMVNSPAIALPSNPFTASAEDGWMAYFWNDGETDTDGTFDGEFEGTFPDGRIQTFPTTRDPAAEYLTIFIPPDLDVDLGIP